MVDHGPSRDRLRDAAVARLKDAPGIEAVFLSGSLARGAGDAASDLDLVAVCGADAAEDAVAAFRAALESVGDVVMLRVSRGFPRLANAVAGDWTRVDLLLTGRDGMARSPAVLAPLHDPDGLGDRAPAEVAVPPGQVAFLIEEYLRVHGLLAVAVARGEWVTGVSGWSLQREALIRLMRIDAGARDTGGVLHLSQILPAADMEALAALPSPAPERGAVIAAHLAVARLFLPRARATAARLGVDWPEAFEAATARYLDRALGLPPEETMP